MFALGLVQVYELIVVALLSQHTLTLSQVQVIVRETNQRPYHSGTLQLEHVNIRTHEHMCTNTHIYTHCQPYPHHYTVLLQTFSLQVALYWAAGHKLNEEHQDLSSVRLPLP